VTKEKGRESNDLLLLTAITIEPLTLGDDSSDTRNCTCEYVAIRPGIAQENLMGEELRINVAKNALPQIIIQQQGDLISSAPVCGCYGYKSRSGNQESQLLLIFPLPVLSYHQL